MRIKELTLFTNNLLAQKSFFKNNLKFDLLDESDKEFSIQVGWTKLKFKHSTQNHIYHYCFLIPSNKLNEAIEWLHKKAEIINIEDNRIIQYFKNWNAHSIYFYDASGNLAEFIVRHDLKNDITQPFNLSHLLCVNEIGMPSQDIKKINTHLEEVTSSKFWKGDFERFGTNGSQEGLFLLVNKDVKTTWFPTQVKTEDSPFIITVVINQKEFSFEYVEQEIIFMQ